MPRGQAADDLRRYGDLLQHEYAWGALDQSVDVSTLVDDAVAGLADTVGLDELHETIWRIQANFKDTDARVSLPEEACDLDECTCSGVSLAALRGQTHQTRGNSDGHLWEYAFAVCGEVPLAAIPSACGWTTNPHAAVVRWDVRYPSMCAVVVQAVGGGGAMSSTKTDDGLTISFTSEAPACTNSFVLELTPARATDMPYLAPVQTHGCYRRTQWATANVSALGHEPLFAPFLVYETSPGVFVALRPDRTGWIDAGHPVLQKIDGVAIAEWVHAAEALTGQRRRAVRLLNDVWRLRQLPELQSLVRVVDASKVSLELATLDGVAAAQPVLLLGVSVRPSYGDGLDAWPLKELPGQNAIGAQILPGNVGYLRIPTMEDVPETDPALKHPSESLGLRAVLQAMHEDETGSPPGVFATDGLVIDVRGNFGGGSRKIVQALVPYFMTNVDRRNCPLIASASAALKSRNLSPSWGASGYLEKLSSISPQSDYAAAIERFSQSFSPTGADGEGASQALKDQFEMLEFMPIPSLDFEQTEGTQMNVNDWYHYANPVIVLQDEDSQGAVEVLLAALKALTAIAPNIKLMGQTSGGGVTTTGMFNISTGQPFSSSEEYTLPNSKIRVRLAATAAFMPTADGATYSGHGVTPDIKFDTVPSSLLVGQPDAMLNAALAELLNMTAASRGATSCSRATFPTAEDQTSQVCFRAYGQAFDSTEQGECWQQSRGHAYCTGRCQDSITNMLRKCANDTYESIVQYYTQYTQIRGFNSRAVLALQIMGPPDCDYSLLSADTRCNPTCSMKNLVNGTDQRWVNLRKCLDLNAHYSSVLAKAVPVWNQDTCTSDECEQHFHDLVLDCRACDTDIEFASFLNLAAKNLVLCREAAASCDSVIASVRDACCAGVDCAPDGFPTICSYSRGRQHFGGSMCQQSVVEAEEMCPLHLLNNSRLQGLYVVRVPVACYPLSVQY